MQLEEVDSFVAGTRQAVFVRRADSLLLVRPEKTLGLNATAVRILEALYHPSQRPAATVLAELAPRLGVDVERLLADTRQLMQAVRAVLNEDFAPRPGLRLGKFDRGLVRYPILGEIALTYDCQNRCSFCYAASPHRRAEHRLMSTEEVKRVMGRMFREAHVPSLSFTGGEPTLRPDLPALISHGKAIGFRVNLISNGLRAADPAFAERLVGAGLDSAQISLEAAQPELHDQLVGRPGAFVRTVAGVRALRALGIHVHTNTTLCAENLAAAPDLIRYVARTLGLGTLSMNMLIRTGLGRQAGPRAVTYSEIAAQLPSLLEVARAEGVRLIWYSPIPYCIFNPVLHGLGAKACACIDGILSVDPAGELLPCSSFGTGIGSLLENSYQELVSRRAARYWRRKRYLPPVCRRCEDRDVCGGGCPLYWDAAGSFAELPQPEAADQRARRRWERGRRRGGSFGVPAPLRGIAPDPLPATRISAWDD
jgi:radical SAM protein with 4Fe4S-binding SPASM domain